MKKPSLTFISLSLLIIMINPNSISAHFFANISSIPSSLIQKTTIWDAFNNLAGCRKGQNFDGLSKLKKYLLHFGYLNNSYLDFSDDFDDLLESAVKTYQLNFNLNPTGELDVPTQKHIALPRCGNADIINGASSMNSGKPNHSGGLNSTIHAVAHYSFFPNRPRWPASKSELTYSFQPDNQLSAAVRGVFSRAFQRWSEVTTLTFTEVATLRKADIRIGFFSGDHGDGEAFDGVMGTLAHAFSPPNGRLHLDGEENWLIDGDFLTGSPQSVVDLESVAVHEIGHVIGLGHSSDTGAIMYPTISSGQRKVDLASDDILGIQELYGSNPNYNGSVGLTRRARDTGRAGRVDYSLLWASSLLLLGLFV